MKIKAIAPTPLCIFIISFITAALVQAQAAKMYNLSWYTIDSGGHIFSTGGEYGLGGTIGQPDIGIGISHGGIYNLTSGFWIETSQVSVHFQIYLPLIMKNPIG